MSQITRDQYILEGIYPQSVHNLGKEFARAVDILNGDSNFQRYLRSIRQRRLITSKLNDPLNLGRFELTRSNQLEVIAAGPHRCEDEEIVNVAIINFLQPLFIKEPDLLFLSSRVQI